MSPGSPSPAARVGAVADPGPEVAALLAKGTQHDGRPLSLMAVLAHRPKVLRSVISLGGALWQSDLVTPRERELIILRTAWRTGCEYEFGHHRLLAPACGVTEDELRGTAVADLADGPWSSAEATMLAAVDELCALGEITEPTWTALSPDWPGSRLVDLVALVGTYRFIGLVVGGLALSREPGVPGWFEGPRPS